MRPRGGSVLPGACGNTRTRAALAFALAVLAACARDTPTETSPVKTITLVVEQPQILVGETTRIIATLIDAGGRPVLDRAPAWRSLTPAVLSVGPTGEVTGLQAGTGQVRASSGSAVSDVIVIVTNRLAATINFSTDTATLALPGGSLQIIAAVTDVTGQAVVNPAILWSSSAPQIAAVNVVGLVTAVASGSAVITGAIDGIAATLAVTVRPAPVAGAPVILNLSPPILRPGAAYTVTGTNFAPTPGGNLVLVDGFPATVQVATTTQLTIVLPTAGFICEPSRDAFLQITVNGRIGGRTAPLQTANRRELAPGEAVIVANQSEVRCNELVPASGRWVISAYNATRNTVSPTSTGNVLFMIRGTAGPPAPGAPPAGVVAGVPAGAGRNLAPIEMAGIRSGVGSPRATRQSAVPGGADSHLSVLDRNLAVLRDALTRRNTLASATSGSVVAPVVSMAQLTTVGAITPLKVPNLDAADFCVSNTQVGFRTVYAGPRVVIVEDTTTVLNGKPTQKGRVDAYLRRLGDEFESVVWPLITANFGNPLAMDGPLGGPGRVVMVFSPRVNTMQRGGLLAFVASCDLFPVAQRPSSNLGAYFYAAVPTTDATGYATPDSRDQWLRLMRATIVHELKHVTAFAERVSRGFAFEDLSWEEGSARVAEELYARTFYGSSRGSNTRYAGSIGCDLKFNVPGSPCADRPILTLRHFDGLYSYMAGPELNTVLGRAFTGDLNFYSGAWSVLRWAADHFAPAEGAFFKELTTSSATGTANLEARTGRRWEDMLGEWSLAAYLDDVGGFVPANTALAMPSWNYPDVWLGMCIEMGPCVDPSNPLLLYLRSTPFAPRQRSFGNFQVGIGSMVGGGFTLLDLSGPGSSSQVLEVKSLISDADAPASVRIAFVRVR